MIDLAELRRYAEQFAPGWRVTVNREELLELVAIAEATKKIGDGEMYIDRWDDERVLIDGVVSDLTEEQMTALWRLWEGRNA
jgi:hypothetical protein